MLPIVKTFSGHRTLSELFGTNNDHFDHLFTNSNKSKITIEFCSNAEERYEVWMMHCPNTILNHHYSETSSYSVIAIPMALPYSQVAVSPSVLSSITLQTLHEHSRILLSMVGHPLLHQSHLSFLWWCPLPLSRTKHVWYSEHGTYCQFKIILEQVMSATHVAVIPCTRTSPAYEEEFMKMDYPDARNEYGTSYHPSHEKTILERVMTTWCIVDITPSRMSQEAEETKEKRKRKAQIMFLAPSVKFRRPMPAFQLFEYCIHF